MGRTFRVEGEAEPVTVGEKFHHRRYTHTSTRWGLPPSISLASDKAPSISFPYDLRIPHLSTEPPQLHLLVKILSSFSQPHSFFVNRHIHSFILLRQDFTLLQPSLFASLGLAHHLHFDPLINKTQATVLLFEPTQTNNPQKLPNLTRPSYPASNRQHTLLINTFQKCVSQSSSLSSSALAPLPILT